MGGGADGGGGGGRRSVVGASEFKSEDPGFDPQAGQGEGVLSVPPSQLLCQQILFSCTRSPFVCMARTQICAHIKDSSICCKRVGLTAGQRMETQKHCTQEDNKKGWVPPYYACSLLLGREARSSQVLVHCIGTRKLSNLI